MINVWIDEFTPCLKDMRSGELVNTEVVRVKRKSFLSKYNKKNGWYTNWAELLNTCDVYALVLTGTVDIQGLVAVCPDDDMKALKIAWMCAAPENNKLIVDCPKFSGVGGHLFAMAARLSIQYGFDGLMYGYAANETILRHYVETFNAEVIGIFHPYHFAIDEETAHELMGVYSFEWSDDEI